METLVKHSEGEQVEVDGGAPPPSGAKKPAPKGKVTYSFSKANPKKPSALEFVDVDVEDLVHEIENLKKEDALARIPQLVDTHEVTYFKLGGVLSVIHNKKFYDPYDLFDKWVENETPMKRAKARALIQIYDAIANSGISSAQVKNIGWTKLRVIARLLTKDNVLDWIEKASSHKREELEELVKGHLAGLGGSVSGVSTATHTKTFKFHDDQNEMVEAALDKAKKVSGTPHDSVAFEHICLDYMGGQTMAQRLKTVSPANGAKAVAEAYEGEAQIAFIKAFGVKKLLHAIDAAAPNLNIEVSEAFESDLLE